MINRAHRFHGYGSLKYVYRHGHTARGQLFSIRAVENPRRESYRFAVVVSRKVNKSAVARNRIRRRLYEAVRLMESEIRPYDIVLTVFIDAVANEPFESLTKQIKKQLAEVGALQNSAKS